MKTVIDAVNEFKGVLPSDRCVSIIMARFGFYDYKAGDLKLGAIFGGSKYWEVICTKEEFNQCVKELSEAKWMSKPVYTQEMKDKGELPSVGMKFIDVLYNKHTVVTAIFRHDNQVVYVAGKGNGKKYFGAELRECKPIDTRTDKEKTDDLFKIYLKGEQVSTHKTFTQAVIDGDFGDNVKWVGES